MVKEETGLPLTKPPVQFPMATQKPVFNIKRSVNSGYDLQREMPLDASAKSTQKD
jgi:hypothetical protein